MMKIKMKIGYQACMQKRTLNEHFNISIIKTYKERSYEKLICTEINPDMVEDIVMKNWFEDMDSDQYDGITTKISRFLKGNIGGPKAKGDSIQVPESKSNE